MGTGGRVSAAESEQGTHEGAEGFSPLLRVPAKKPPFTLSQIKNSIPPHCFRRSILRSFYYLAVDLAFVALFLYVAVVYIPNLPSPFRLAAWPLYWACQGCVLTGVWMVAHDCGHNAFSNYPLLDDIVGFTLHSTLLVPYFSWKYSHRRHHSTAGCLERDETYVPKLKGDVQWYSRYLNSPLGRFLVVTVMLTLGWPLYAAFNAWGHQYDRLASHYDPNSPIYTDRERAQIMLSDAGILTASYGLYRLASAFGFLWLFKVYGVPLMITNAFVVLITYLHHTHPALPHYLSSDWDWLRGALSTVDRDYGFLNKVFHHITDTHVVHHLFSTMPHYHGVEATRAVKPVLGDYYRLDTTPIAKALWREVKECLYVEPDDATDAKERGILWYKNKY